MEWTVENLLTSKHAFAVPATPLQRAIARSLDGRPLEELWDDQTVQRAFGYVRPAEIGATPATVCIVSAIRCGKTIMAAAKVICASQTVKLDGLAAGDEVRIPLLATGKDNARAAYSHVVNTMMVRPELKKLIMEDPTAESVWIRHPSGKAIEVTISALSRAGSTLVSRWLPCVVFDEGPRMAGEDDAVKNLEQSIDAVDGRILPGGCIMVVGSPHAPIGPVYKMVKENFGNPTPKCLVIRSRGPDMNPAWWTPERCAELKQRNPKAYRTDVEAEFADAEESLFPSALVERAMRAKPVELDPHPGHSYVAAIDPGGRASAWTFVILEALERGFRVALARQWTKNAEGVFRAGPTMDEVAAECARFGITDLHSDQYGFEATSALAEERGLTLLLTDWNADNRYSAAQIIKSLLEVGELELPPVDQMREDLVRVRKKVTSNGVTIDLPRGGGRHCDFFPTLALCLMYPPEPPATDPRTEKKRQREPGWTPTKQEKLDTRRAAMALMRS
jgi:hypothetical protein